MIRGVTQGASCGRLRERPQLASIRDRYAPIAVTGFLSHAALGLLDDRCFDELCPRLETDCMEQIAEECAMRA